MPQYERIFHLRLGFELEISGMRSRSASYSAATFGEENEEVPNDHWNCKSKRHGGGLKPFMQ
jgi:hypothetical protein